MKQDYITTYYRPMLRKTFETALTHFVTREFPFLKGSMLVNLFVKELKKLVDAHYPPTSHLRPGQMVWMAVDKREKIGYKKSITETKTKPIVLTILNREDLLKYLNRVPLREDPARCLGTPSAGSRPTGSGSIRNRRFRHL